MLTQEQVHSTVGAYAAGREAMEAERMALKYRNMDLTVQLLTAEARIEALEAEVVRAEGVYQ
jgi:hypothetical protein